MLYHLFLHLLVFTNTSFNLPTSSSFQFQTLIPNHHHQQQKLQRSTFKMTSSSTSTTKSSSNNPFTKKTIAIIGVTCNPSFDPSPSILKEGIQDLFKLYFDELYHLGCDLGFQGFQNEWIDLPGKYCFNNKGGIYVAVEIDYYEHHNDNDCDNNNDHHHHHFVVIQPGTTDTNEKLQQLIQNKNQVVGCIAIRPLTNNCGELKRMYIRQSHRRLGIGKELAKCIMDYGFDVDKCDYMELKLDSLERLKGAVGLYEDLGFRRMEEPYCECPEDDHVCMNLFRK